jgi:alpha-soluble NSF attachment protein
MSSIGDAHLDIAEKIIRKFRLDCFDKEKFEEAYDEFKKAANYYKNDKNWIKATYALERCVEMQQRLKDNSTINEINLELFKVTKNYDHHKAIDILKNNCIPYLIESGKYSQATKLYEDLAPMFEKDEQLDEAIACYKKALHYCEADCLNNSTKFRVLDRLASLSAKSENYTDAIQYYEDLGLAQASTPLKFSIKENYFNACLCYLANSDVVSARDAYNKYIELDYTFVNSPLGKLALEIIIDVENMDVDSFTTHVSEYDRISKLDSLRVSLLLRTKNSMLL